MAPHNDVEAFHEVLRSSKRILALCGAGLSASSGLPTFRGAGGLWRNHDSQRLATMRAFKTDPGLVWLFYGYRRHLCLKAEPNPGHHALAALARENKDFICLTQNVDSKNALRLDHLPPSTQFSSLISASGTDKITIDLHQRVNHPQEQLFSLHGSLFDLKCSKEGCGWVQRGNFDDPFCPALAPASEDMPPGETLPLLDPYHRIKHVTEEELPKCPRCEEGLQRPGVVWFGEDLDIMMLDGIEQWLGKGKLVSVGRGFSE